MIRFLLRWLLQTVPIVLAVALVIFVLFSVIPGSFASSLGDDGRSTVDAQVAEDNGLPLLTLSTVLPTRP